MRPGAAWLQLAALHACLCMLHLRRRMCCLWSIEALKKPFHHSCRDGNKQLIICEHEHAQGCALECWGSEARVCGPWTVVQDVIPWPGSSSQCEFCMQVHSARATYFFSCSGFGQSLVNLCKLGLRVASTEMQFVFWQHFATLQRCRVIATRSPNVHNPNHSVHKHVGSRQPLRVGLNSYASVAAARPQRCTAPWTRQGTAAWRRCLLRQTAVATRWSAWSWLFPAPCS